MEELIQILQKTVSSSQADQNDAVRYISEFCRRDFISFIQALADVLYDTQNQPVVRAAAGLQLKNQLTARDDNLRREQQERWRRLPEPNRLHIKDRVFKSLGTEIFRPSSAPQCIAYIAIAELTEKQWPEFVSALVQNAHKSPATNDKLKLATLEAIGYICQEIVASEHLQNVRKREITNGLNSSMATIYSFIGQCISSQNYELMTTSLQCLGGFMSWAQINQNLIRMLCQLLEKCIQVPTEFSDEKLAIINSTCDCLNVCLERKHSKTDSFEVRTSIYEDKNNLHAVISALSVLNRLPLPQDPQGPLESMKKLSQVITNVVKYIFICHPEKPQHLQDMYSIMKVIIAHPSITVNVEAMRFWNKVFALAPKKPNPSINDELTATLLTFCAQKLIRAKYDCRLYSYEFDCQQDLDVYQGRYRGEICELCRNLTLQNEQICFKLVGSSIAGSIQKGSTDLSEWDALSFLSSAVCNKMKDPSVFVMDGIELTRALLIYMNSTLQQASKVPSDATGSEASLIPDLISAHLSCLSAMYVFLPYWHQTDKELTKDLLRMVILFAFHRPDKFIESSRQLVGNNTSLLNNESFMRGFRALSRHASAHFVRVCMDHSKHLLDVFDFLKSYIDDLFSVVDNPYSTEKCQLYEGLTLICNENPDECTRKKFVLELLSSKSIIWFKDYELTCKQFIDFVGFNRFEIEQEGLDAQKLISQPMPASQQHRVELSYVVSFIQAIVRRLSSKETLLPEILAFARPLLNLIFNMHALWLPEMKALCDKEYQPFLFAPFNSSYKQQILDTILVQNSAISSDNPSPTGNSTIGDVPNRPSKGSSLQYIEIFSWNFYEALLTTMGTIINKTSPELFSYNGINVIHLQTALTGAEYLPSLKMHKLLKQLIMPLINNCSKDQQLIDNQLLPLLSKLLPFLFEALDGQWKKVAREESNPSNGVSDGKLDQTQQLADEMVRDQLLRNLSRDFIDLMNMILIESTPPPVENNSSNNNSNSLVSPVNQGNTRQDPHDLYKIGMLGLKLLAGGPDFIINVMASTLTWSDSTLNFKSIFIIQQLVRHILTPDLIKQNHEASVWLGSLFRSVVTSLGMFGEHEQNCSGLLTLFLTLYENLNKAIPNFHEHLEQMTGIPRGAFSKYDQDNMKSNEKSKRAALRKILDSLVGKNASMIMR